MRIGKLLSHMFRGDERAEAEEKLIRAHLDEWVSKYGDKYIAVSVSDGVVFDSDEDDRTLHRRVIEEIPKRGRILVMSPSRYRIISMDPVCVSCGTSAYSGFG